MNERHAVFSLLLILALTDTALAETPKLSIEANHPTARVSPMFYGLMTEEINFSYDGGLYAELVRNRAIGRGRRPLFHWTMVARGNSVVNIAVDDKPVPARPCRGA